MQEFLAGPGSMFVFLVPMIALFYFLILRPQSQQIKKHKAMIEAIKRGETVVLSNGMIGKVTRVENDQVMVEIAQGVNVPVVKSMIADVRNRTAVAANDAKA
ncbi:MULTISPECIES: preprotein translocase subunit YajC [unclassified Brevundimonas]|uniref:preprotein translocase subunit YajC n=1 Tax=unclassified Brevundimonas TaxID=2622653 RepID=UPI003B5898D0